MAAADTAGFADQEIGIPETTRTLSRAVNVGRSQLVSPSTSDRVDVHAAGEARNDQARPSYHGARIHPIVRTSCFDSISKVRSWFTSVMKQLRTSE